MYEKLKSYIADDGIFMVLLLLLVGIVSFGLGRQSVIEKPVNMGSEQPAGIVLTQMKDTVAQKTESAQAEAGKTRVVGSRSGTKYHLLTCPGAKQMKEENKIFFDSITLAKAAGYTPAANCPGL